MTERERLLAFLFDRDDKKVLNVKFFRGNAKDLTVDQMCLAAKEVIAHTWENEGNLLDAPPISNSPKIDVLTLR